MDKRRRNRQDWLARLMRRSRVAGSCIIWTGPKTEDGYGYFSKDSRNQKTHKVAYEAQNGLIPKDLVIDHLCRNRACLNPAHMEPVTNRENILRGVSFSAKNARKRACKNGHIFSGRNLRFRPDGSRRCGSCNRIQQIKYRKRSEEALSDQKGS